jgi:hypothetical protein
MTTDYIDIIKKLRDIAQDRELPKQAKRNPVKKDQRYLGQRCKKQKSAMTTQEKGASYWKGGLP